MKISQYLYCKRTDAGHIAWFNYATNRVITICPELYQIVQSKTEAIQQIEQIHPDLYRDLVANRYVVADEEDEARLVMDNITKKLESSDILRVTINPTMDCNLRCWYCYESHTEFEYLTIKKQLAILKFIRKELANENVKMLHLSLFGGEPLMKASKIAIPLIKEIRDICLSYKKAFHVNITSNGTLLTKTIVDGLANLFVPISIQIAFDGGRETHNKIKFFSNGKGAYDLTLRNIKYALSNHITINIRFNYNIENIDSYKSVIEDLKNIPADITSNLRFSLHKVWQSKDSSELRRKVHLLDELIKKQFLIENDVRLNMGLKFCYADYKNSYVINYNGDVFKCTARDFKHQDRIGELTDGGEIHYVEKSSSYNCRFCKECETCRMLPICTTCIQNRVEKMKGGKCPSPMTNEQMEKELDSRLDRILNN